MALLEIRNVTRRFGSYTAVDNVSISIETGEFFTLLGPSGCGKTTLLRMIAGFDLPDSGQILLDGKDMVGTPPEKRPVHTVFQTYALFPHMTVADNIAFPLKMAGKPPHGNKNKSRRGLGQRTLVRISATVFRMSYRADKNSAWHLPEGWSTVRGCCCWMSRWARWTRSCARRCRSNSSICRKKSALRSYSLPTPRMRRWRCRIASR